MSTYRFNTLLQANVNVFTFMCLPVNSAGIKGGSSGGSSDKLCREGKLAESNKTRIMNDGKVAEILYLNRYSLCQSQIKRWFFVAECYRV